MAERESSDKQRAQQGAGTKPAEKVMDSESFKAKSHGSGRTFEDSKRENLRLALLVAAASLAMAVLPIWPYGLYTLLRLFVTGVSLFALFVIGIGSPKQTLGYVVVALVFNPVIPVSLHQIAWLPIDLGVAYWFWQTSLSLTVLPEQREDLAQ